MPPSWSSVLSRSPTLGWRRINREALASRAPDSSSSTTFRNETARAGSLRKSSEKPASVVGYAAGHVSRAIHKLRPTAALPELFMNSR